jgi:hypothetical protein
MLIPFEMNAELSRRYEMLFGRPAIHLCVLEPSQPFELFANRQQPNSKTFRNPVMVIRAGQPHKVVKFGTDPAMAKEIEV